MMKRAKLSRRGFLKSAAGVVAISAAVPATLWSGRAAAKGPARKDAAAAQPARSEWEATVAKLEAEGVLTQTQPGKWDGKQGSHIPRLTFHEGEGAVTLFTKHGMSRGHWITAHYVRDQDGKLIGLQTYEGTDAEARHRFTLPKGTTRITAYSHCNKHGDWRAADASPKPS